ncbi:phage baseplate protein [Lederbergia lenta]|uniref:Polyglycerol phosphate assembly and export protein (Teichoic acid biosynthesis) n=1 Tax=Lederbergia lenta TaxID=1467 RepID=A0A2X4WJ90_LEDLE|nr:hypothetical protein [Lederbergia lenta]MEC2323186.1 hypothetical protein [Lederbergia lenta]SQI62959.1 polyglycerol phosphate assembly and export protein (teichoic acid biosynthesis) [Lederbergia lenta]
MNSFSNSRKNNYGIKFTVLIVIICLSIMPVKVSAALKMERSKMFDISAPASELFREKSLKNDTVLQSIAFDHVNRHVYIAQLMSGGQQLPDENNPVSGAKRAIDGDIALTQLDMQGNILGHMFLKGFGHGVSIGVEIEGSTPYIWMEVDAVAEGKNGWGTKLTRFPFKQGSHLSSNSPRLDKYELISDADRTTVNIDMAYGLLTMRYRISGQYRLATYSLQQVKKHNYSAISDIAQPKMGIFQGFASYGRYIYLLEGAPYGTKGSVKPIGNTYITVVDLITGKVINKKQITAGSDLSFREPEGMGVYIPNPDAPEKARLYFGFASTISEANKSKLVSIYGFEDFTS